MEKIELWSRNTSAPSGEKQQGTKSVTASENRKPNEYLTRETPDLVNLFEKEGDEHHKKDAKY
jgi:hypothetical protein